MGKDRAQICSRTGIQKVERSQTVKVPGQEQWFALWQRAGLRGDAPGCFERLMDLYSQPHRAYHNGRHIADCLQEFDSAKHLAENVNAVELAIWFHDAIYDPRATDNEERSAELAAECLVKAEATSHLVRQVRELVLATKHTRVPANEDEKLLVDVDLSILGQSEERFAEYEAQIRQEYVWVPREVFNSKRAEILEQFLARPTIFSTEWLQAKYEEQARRNIEASIRNLGRPTT
jgi:predicted metal-dependent HD superfamily phosphohydrolase